MTDDQLRVVQDGELWQLSGPAASRFVLINELPGLPGRPGLLAAHRAVLRVRPAGVRPLVGR